MAADEPVRILCIETSAALTSVALSRNGECEALKELPQANTAADKLHILLAALLEEVALDFSAINAIALSSGPGSYTGLRIGLSAAKGYCFACDIPLIGISTFQSMVHGLQARYERTAEIYVPMVDARRMEVFTAFCDANGQVIRPFHGLVLDDKAADLFDPENKYILFGSGAAKARPLLGDKQHIQIFEGFMPSAMDLCALAYKRYKEGIFDELAMFQPDYTKAFHSTARS